jgi:hypothetical protein
MNITLKSLVAESRKNFGKTRATRNLRRQWIAKTYELLTRGIHLRQNGKFPGNANVETPPNPEKSYRMGSLELSERELTIIKGLQ